MNPVPFGAIIHLCGLPTYASQPSAFTSTWTWPTACAPSTIASAPRLVASAHNSRAGSSAPSPLVMWLNITTFVRDDIADSNRRTTASGPPASAGSSGSSLTTMPRRFASSRQGEMPPPCSWSVLTTSSPGARSRPLARKLMPIVAFCVSAMSAAGALTNRPSASRTSSIGW